MVQENGFLPQILDGEDKSSSLKNCIRNNYRHIRKWAKRTETNCFRLYDKEVPHSPVAIDFYDGRFCIHYFSKKGDQAEPSVELVQEIAQILYRLFGVSENEIFWRTRAKTKETRQYEKKDNSKDFFTVLEYGVKFRINLIDYLDTGLFLDHRETRQIVASQAKNKKVLNLFAYTCAFSIHAAKAGASFTKSVDLSNTYTKWGEENFFINHLPLRNNWVVRADCLKFLEDEIRTGAQYDLIIIDPPTISRSKKMSQLFDVQKDYIFLITNALKLLSKEGTIYFSTNSRQFKFDPSQFPSCLVTDISFKTVPIDFQKHFIHSCWKITS